MDTRTWAVYSEDHFPLNLSHIYLQLFLKQLLFIRVAIYIIYITEPGLAGLFIEFLHIAPTIPLALVTLGPLSHDKLSINSRVAILTVSKERRKWSNI